MLTLNNLSFSFHNNKVLRNINISFNKETLTVFMEKTEKVSLL